MVGCATESERDSANNYSRVVAMLKNKARLPDLMMRTVEVRYGIPVQTARPFSTRSNQMLVVDKLKLN